MDLAPVEHFERGVGLRLGGAMKLADALGVAWRTLAHGRFYITQEKCLQEVFR
ncbi:MAG TPA: hypothetical protein VJT73_11385 [Polyangiaceae bacterium]|nr:hypothetical protein [Polyangiaceae bacterium]